MKDVIRIIKANKLPSVGIPCERIQIGGRKGYKPNVIKFKNGELLMANFHTHCEVFDDGQMCEHTVLHRSMDNGNTWKSQHYDYLLGREPYLNVFSGDTVLITTHLIESDVRNLTGNTDVWIHRSTDKGKTWQSWIIDLDIIPEEVSMTCSSRNIIEYDDAYIMGVGCEYGKDYIFRSHDKGLSWDAEKVKVLGFDKDKYQSSVFPEGVFHITDTGRLLLFARCDIRRMNFDTDIPGLPDIDAISASDCDHYDVEIIFESPDNGMTWKPVSAVPLLGCMYPSVCNLGENRYLLTYTKRTPDEKFHMGVYAIILEENDGNIRAETESDVIVIDEKTPDYFDSGGGFGNTLKLEDGTFITPYSYLHADSDIEELMKSGKFLEKEIFNYYRNKAYHYYKPITWERIIESDKVDQVHEFLGCCAVLNLCGPITEIAKWKISL